MGLLDKLPWKKDKEFLPNKDFDFGSAPGDAPDPFGDDTNDSFSNLRGDPLAGTPDPAQSRPDPFASDPMGSSFAPDPTESRQSNSQYPGAAPFPGQNRVAPREHHDSSGYDEPPSRDVELILAKLDAIKAELDSLHQRVRKIESVSDTKSPRKITW